MDLLLSGLVYRGGFITKVTVWGIKSWFQYKVLVDDKANFLPANRQQLKLRILV